MLRLLISLSFGCHALSREISPEGLAACQWETFKLQYNKTYKDETEEQYRQEIFMDNLHRTNKHNELYEMELSTYKRGLNHFSDLMHSEFLEMYTMTGYLPEFTNENQDLIYEPKNTDFEETVDWRTKGAVTPVKDQEKQTCNDGWAFATTGALEAQWKIKKGTLVSLSEQNLLDCSKDYGNSCKGGLFPQALQYVIQNGGIDTEASYPYRGRELMCRFKEENVGAKAKNSVQVKRGSESDLQNVIQNIGPVAAMIDASQPEFQNPTRGIYDNPSCSQTKLTHIVLVVGYGSAKGHDYWLVKNSWGKSWGENGYIRMSRNKNNQCGIANYAYYPIVDDK